MRKDTKYINFAEFEGNVAPADVELEKVVLGAVMLEDKCLLEIGSLLSPDIFSAPAHVEICKAILKLHADRAKVDILTVPNQLRADKELTTAGGSVYVASLTNRVGSSANIKYHTLILHQKSFQRKLIAIGYDMVRNGYNDLKDCFEAVEEAEAALKSILSTAIESENEMMRFAELVKQEYDASELLANGGTTGVMCGIGSIDRVINGFKPGTLTYIAARPGMGKSVLARGIAKGAAKLKHNVPFFSLEMSDIEVMQCLIADECNINLEDIIKGKLTDEQITLKNNHMGALANIGLFIDDKATNSPRQIWAKCNRLKSTIGIGMVVIDYLQLMPAPELPANSLENSRLEYISRILKLMAKDLEVPVIALSQLSRALESRTDKRPMLSDLRGSGAIEQDADMVCFLYRPDYYHIQSDENGIAYPAGYTELIVAKYRMGQTGIIELLFNGANQRFTGLNDIPSTGAITPYTNFDVDYQHKLTKNVPF